MTPPALPPQNLDAERSLLGGVLRDPDVLPDLLPVVRPDAFYFDAHRRVFAAVCDLAGAGKPVDLVSLHDELRRRKESDDCGGAAYLAELWEAAATGANALYHAKLVRDAATLRGLIHAANEILRDAHSPAGPAEEVLAAAERKLYALAAEARGAEGGARWVREIAGEVLQSIDERIAGGGALAGLATGYADLDAILGGMRPGELIVLGARPSLGKAQPLTTPVLTPAGFVPMGDLRIGDRVIGSDGRPTRVVGVYPQGKKAVYRVTFTDGAATECCAEHLWFTRTRGEQKRGAPGAVRSLAEVMSTLRRPDSPTVANHIVPHVAPVEFDRLPVSLPIDPWALGVFLGDGNLSGHMARVNKPERDVQDRLVARLPDPDTATATGTNAAVSVRRRRFTHGKAETVKALDRLGLMGRRSHEKFIPEMYLYAPPADRLALLRGLLDTDGSVVPGAPTVEFGTSSRRLADGVEFLARSLGGTVRRKTRAPWYTYRGERRQGRTAYRVYVRLPDGVCPVSSEKHLARWSPADKSRGFEHRIASVEPIGEAECQCIQVEAADGLYVTSDFVVTHNTALSLNIAERVASGGAGVLFCSLEMPARDITERLLSMGSGVPMHRLTRPRDLRPDDIDALQQAGDPEGVAGSPIYVDDASDQTAARVASEARRAVRKYAVQLVVVDYLQLMRPENPRDNRTQQVGALALRMKQCARSLGVPLILLSQLNRELEHANRRPRLADLRESGDIEAHADRVILLHRESDLPADQAVWPIDVIVAKNRNGPVGDLRLAYRRPVLRFENCAVGGGGL